MRDTEVAEQRLLHELSTHTWVPLGRHNHYFLAMALPKFRAEMVRLAASGFAVQTIATQLGVTPERVQSDLNAAIARMKQFCETRPHWLPWCVSYQMRVRQNPSVGASFL